MATNSQPNAAPITPIPISTRRELQDSDSDSAVGIDFTRHSHTHQEIQSELKRIKDAVIAKNCNCPEHEEDNYINTLRYCLFKHIKEDSRPLKVLLDTQLYDFKPDNVTAV